MAKQKKTNAERLLEAAKINFEAIEYKVDPNDLSGEHIAREIGISPSQMFKTLVLKGEKNGHVVCCISTDKELDLKKVASQAGEKKIEMIPEKQLLATTGYIRGGCSPVGMKKQFPTVIDETIFLCETMIFSAGKVGYQVEMTPETLSQMISYSIADVTV